MELSLGPSVRFTPLGRDDAAALMDALRAAAPGRFEGAAAVLALGAALPFYPRHGLVDLRFAGPHGAGRAFLLRSAEGLVWLDGSAAPIHEVNEREALDLADARLLDYVRFFLFFVRGDEGPFVLVETPAALPPDAAAAFQPFETKGVGEDGRPLVAATIAYGRALFRATFALARSGEIEMIEDEPLAEAAGPLPELPALAPSPIASGAAQGAPEETAAATPSAEEPAGDALAAGDGAGDRRVTGIVVSVLLAEAAAAKIGHRLLQRFNTRAGGGGALGPLARFVQEFTPIILIEAGIPFVEEVVADLLDPTSSVFTAPLTERGTAIGGDDACCSIDSRNSRTRLYLASFHAYRRLWDAEWTAHRLSIGGATVLVGCERRADVPEPLRRVADLVLTLPRIDARLFAEIFSRLFGAAPPDGWDAGGGEWCRYLLHSDFHAPARLRLAPADAVAHLRERCESRLAQVSADRGPGLDELHGLGEAKQVAEDLIADIAAARSGVLPWQAVDRGLLLVGPPGTGKTTLARAISRACGIKFIFASATEWQAHGSLDAHLRAIRQTFAEARRYAPTILFVDEIDSLGSRERLSGPNAQYQVEVINGVLEQIQGLDPDEPVIVIGATNYEDRVDPALRRAGRLDQVVQLPRPSVAALARIFEHHLSAHRRDGTLARDVDAKALATLAFGLTGADVEFFVRGAARRARKARRRIRQADLVAEITGRPRHPEGAQRLTPAEMRRVAVHEAGHALCALLAEHDRRLPAFVSIVPRANGTLGFVATAPADGALGTRREMVERLRMILGGRAAEALVYGEEDISLGSGGGRGSDLEVATRIATSLVCQTGLGADGTLHWTDQPTPSQLRQVDALLRESYRAALRLLRRERGAFERIAEALEREQELDGRSVQALLAPPRGAASKPRPAAPPGRGAARRRPLRR
jgi:AAA+ superfamily predicted ATPase